MGGRYRGQFRDLIAPSSDGLRRWRGERQGSEQFKSRRREMSTAVSVMEGRIVLVLTGSAGEEGTESGPKGSFAEKTGCRNTIRFLGTLWGKLRISLSAQFDAAGSLACMDRGRRLGIPSVRRCILLGSRPAQPFPCDGCFGYPSCSYTPHGA